MYQLCMYSLYRHVCNNSHSNITLNIYDGFIRDNKTQWSQQALSICW